MIEINGKKFSSHASIHMVGGRLIIDGQEVEGGEPNATVIKIIGGSIGELTTDKSVSCEAVTGNVKAGGSVNADNIGGNVDAKGSVNCDDVGGDVRAGGSVNCDDVKGSVTAGGSVRHG